MVVELHSKSNFEVEATNLKEAKEKAVELFSDYELTVDGLDDRSYKVYEKQKELVFIGIDNWDRAVYKDCNDALFKDVGLGKPREPIQLCTVVDNDFYGEPFENINFKFVIEKGKKEFEASSGTKFGKCTILKQTKDKSHTLIYSLTADEFIVAVGLELNAGSWLSGSYFGDDIQKAVEHFNIRNKAVENKNRNDKER